MALVSKSAVFVSVRSHVEVVSRIDQSESFLKCGDPDSREH